MKIFCTMVFTLVVIFNSIELSTQSDESSSRSKKPVPAGSSLRSSQHGSPSRRRPDEYSDVSSYHNESLHQGSTRRQYATPEHAGFEIPHADDILLPLALEKWPLLAETLKKDWPAYAEYYYFVITAIELRSKEPNLPHTIYCPSGDYNSGIFVGISSFGIYRVIPFSHEGFDKLLHKAVTETKIINWAEEVSFTVITSRIISTVYSIIETLKHTKGMEVKQDSSGNVFFLPKEESAALEVRVPEGCYLNRINESYIPLILSFWHLPPQADQSVITNHLMTRVRLNEGFGLFSNQNNELLSSTMRGEFGECVALMTIEKARRKGYAKVVVRAFAKDSAKYGFDMFGLVQSGNVASEAVFRSINSKVIHPYAQIKLKKLGSRG